VAADQIHLQTFCETPHKPRVHLRVLHSQSIPLGDFWHRTAFNATVRWVSAVLTRSAAGSADEALEFMSKPAKGNIMAAHAQGYTTAQLQTIIAYLKQ
jgi:hypothetical protein